MKKAQWLMSSEVGPLYLVADEKYLLGIFWKKQPVPMLKTLEGAGAELKILIATIVQLEEYFLGTRKKFDLPLAPVGTDFQRKVWRELGKIPYAKTISYSELARRVKNKKAVRAVGAANGRNPFCIIVPCHRVVASSGALQGYSGGIKMKSRLLELENAQL